MSRYTSDSRERVRDAVDMLALVSGRVELTRRGVDSYFGCCPFHNEHTPSFHVRPEEKHYHCFGCSESGDPFDFVMQTEGMDYRSALEWLADRFGVKLETEQESPQAAAARARRERLYALLARAATYYERCFWDSPEARPAREYMLGRGLDAELLREFRVGYAPLAWDRVLSASRQAGYSDQELLAAGLAQQRRAAPGKLIDRFRGRIMFPTADARGRVIGFGARELERSAHGPKYLNSAEGEIYHKRSVLYGIALARAAAARAGRMVLVEGYTDVIALHQAGVHNAVGVMGTSLTAEQVAELTRTVTVLELCLDADNAGKDAMMRAAKLCADSGLELRVVALPQGSDPADLIRSDGADALRERIGASVPYIVFEARRILERADLDGAEGKDRAIGALRPVLTRLPASVLRDELVREAAAALSLAPVRFLALLGDGSGPTRRLPATDAPVPPRSSVAAAGQRPLAHPAAVRGPRLERDFLAMCLAAPKDGAALLAQIDADALLTGDLPRRAARLLRATLPATPQAPADDPELGALIGDLVDRAARGRVVTADELEHAHLVLERDRLERERRYLRTHGGPGLPQVALELQAVLGSIRALVARIEGAA